jgi:hypothetical protein
MASDRPRARKSVKYTPQASAPSSPSDGELYYNSSTKKFQIYTGSSWVDLKTTDGLPNYIVNPDAESNASGWNTYADAAASRPVDGTGGTASITWSRTTTNPLSGSGSFQLVKDAVNRQGQGVSVDFNISRRDQAKVLEISFDYEQVSGTYGNGTSSTDSDLIVYIYDTTNARLIEPQAFKIDRCLASKPENFKATFQSSADSTAYRLILHVASTSASAYTINFDNFRVSRQTVVYSSPVTDWQSYTPSYQGFGTVSTSNMRWRRNGDSVEIAGTFVTGTPTAVEARIGLPSGAVTDSSLSTIETCGVLHRGAVSTSNQLSLLVEPSVTYLTLGGVTAASANPLTKVTGSGAAGAGETLSISNTRVKIRGWSSNILSSNDADQRVLAVRATKTSGSHTASGSTQDVTSWTTTYDTHSAFNASSGVFTAPMAGYYRISGVIGFDGNTNGSRIVEVQKNGTGVEALWDREAASSDGNYLSGSTTIKLNAGDTLRMRAFQNSGGSLAYVTNTGYNHLEIERVQGPSSITATEFIGARYTTSAGQSIPNTLTYTTVDFGTRDYDTHAAVTTGGSWRFTAPAAGYYEISATCTFNNLTWNAGNYLGIRIRKTGSSTVDSEAESDPHTNATFYSCVQKTDVIYMVAGDEVRVDLVHNRTAGAAALYTVASFNTIAIRRIGV